MTYRGKLAIIVGLVVAVLVGIYTLDTGYAALWAILSGSAVGVAAHHIFGQ